MKNIKVGFIGGGNMGGALASAAINVLGGENVLLADNTPTNTRVLADKIGATPSKAKEIASSCRLVFLSVKPDIIPIVAKTVRPIVEARADDCAVVSIAAGVTLDSLTEMLGEKTHIIRPPGTMHDADTSAELRICESICLLRSDWRQHLLRLGNGHNYGL